MINKIALIGAATLFAVSVAAAQNNPPPGSVNPGSMKSGAEQSGAENQPRSPGMKGTNGSGNIMDKPASGGAMQRESSPDSTAGGAVGTSKDAPGKQ